MYRREPRERLRQLARAVQRPQVRRVRTRLVLDEAHHRLQHECKHLIIFTVYVLSNTLYTVQYCILDSLGAQL